MRRGITLLESLFAIFVASIGILSLAALLPVGKHQITQAENSDRGHSIAMSALAELQARNLVHYVGGESTVDLNGDGIINTTFADAVVIDPWFLSREPTALLFPYDQTNFYGAGTAPRLPRITPFPALVGQVAHRTMADAVFTSHDDRTFTETTNAAPRPQSLNESYLGDYSWLATVTPSLAQRLQPGGSKTTFIVNVAVFHKRVASLPLNANEVPAERICLCEMIGGGIGGGNVELRVPVAGTTDKHLKVKVGQWIMLAGAESYGSIGPTLTLDAGTGCNRGVVGWYRIAGAGAVATVGTERVRPLTLAGKDWLPPPAVPGNFDSDGDGWADTTYDADATTPTMTLHAYLLDGCINVVERRVTYQPSKVGQPY